MELLIPGLALVALMVYVSTRIKRKAAEAFAEERVETEEFAITKPEGFIIPTNRDPSLAFAAYSKDFGLDDADKIRHVSAELRVHSGKTIQTITDQIANHAVRIISEQRVAGNTTILETEKIKDGITLEAEHRLIERNGRLFHLEVAALSATREEQQKNIDTLLASFEVK